MKKWRFFVNDPEDGELSEEDLENVAGGGGPPPGED